MAKTIGNSFSTELAAAGLFGLPFSWTPDGTLMLSALTTPQAAAVAAVYASHDPTVVPLVQRAVEALFAGVAVTSAGTPALNGTYSMDPAALNRMAGTSIYIAVNGKFPGGVTTYTWVDTGGTPHVFPSTAVAQAFFTAIADRASVLEQIVATGAGTMPSGGVAIA